MKLLPEKRISSSYLRIEAEKIISSDEAIKYLGVTTDEYFKSDFNSGC